MAQPLIALLTDFGLDDVYVGVVKLVLLAGAPSAQIIDLTHGVPPGDVLAGALQLAGAQPHLPVGAVVLAVVDPGVGSTRRAIAVATDRGFWVGPDNGLFSLVLQREKIRQVVELKSPRRISATFHGRDLFAPAAAHLASGRALADLGPAIRSRLISRWPKPRRVGNGLRGQVVHVDRFGNLITNLPPPDCAAQLHIGELRLKCAVGGYYAQVPTGSPIALTSSFGLIEVAIRDGSAHEQLGIGRGETASVRPIYR